MGILATFVVFALFSGALSYGSAVIPVELMIFVTIGSLILGAFWWIEDKAGATAVMEHSWQYLSGAHTSGDVIVSSDSCTTGSSTPGLMRAILWVVIMALLLCNAVLIAIAVIGTPLGIALAAGGALTYLVKRDKETFVGGVLLITAGVGSVIAIGLILRFAHSTSPLVFC